MLRLEYREAYRALLPFTKGLISSYPPNCPLLVHSH